MDRDEYLKERVNDQISYYEKAANKARKKHVGIQTAVIVFALVVPVLVSAESWSGMGAELRVVAIFASLLVAILNGVANFRKYGDLWLSYRMNEEFLKHEKFLFITASGKYEDAKTALSLFVQTVESIISTEHEKFRSLIESATRPTATSAAAE